MDTEKKEGEGYAKLDFGVFPDKSSADLIKNTINSVNPAKLDILKGKKVYILINRLKNEITLDLSEVLSVTNSTIEEYAITTATSFLCLGTEVYIKEMK